MVNQDSANNSTLPPYSTKTCRFGKYLCMNLRKKTPSYLPWPRVEYLYSVRLWRLLVELSRIEPNYSCFRPFMGHSQIISRLWCHTYKFVLPDSSKNLTFILKNSANNSIFVSILNSRSSNSSQLSNNFKK